MANHYLKEMEENKADGIDFIAFGPAKPFPNILASYTKEKLETITATPRAGYKYWKMVNGKKEYID
jgi:hypothetical protein